MQKMNLAKYIDHTILKSDTKLMDIKALCEEAKKYEFASVCIPPYFVNDAVDLLKKTNVKVATVIGFPMGYSATAAKVEEIKRAINDGADELDVVVNVAAVKNADWNFVKDDIESMTLVTHLKSKKIKVIFETALLEVDEIVELCRICANSGVDYVKTSTGFNGGGATVEHVELMRRNLPEKIKIKASGGIRTKEFAAQLINAGAERLGCSASVRIVTS